MGKIVGDKLFRYVKDGRLKRIRSVLQKKTELDIDEFVDKRKRTLLHVACFLGEYAIVKLLINYGARIEAKDSEGNTALHLALQYVLQVLQETEYNVLVKPLLLHSTRELLESVNDAGETPEDLIKKFKKELRKRREDREIYEKEEELKRDEARQTREWNEKLFFEMGSDEYVSTTFTNMDDTSTQETYDEWADRISRERQHKHFEKNQHQYKKDEKAREKAREARERTRLLQEEHEAYIKELSQKRTRRKTLELKSQYESRCVEVFSDAKISQLKFSDIPWPCEGKVEEMVMMVKSWSEGEQNQKKYLRDQQIRWHPDRFLQKCGDRLEADDREQIISAVNELSQGINVLLESE